MKRYLIIALLILSAVCIGCSSITDLAKKDGGTNTAANNSTASTDNSAAETVNSADEGKKDVAADSGEYAPTDDPQADIEKLGDRFLDQKTFRALMETTGKMPMNAELEFQAPDRFRLKNQITSDRSMEMIMIGKQAYMNLNGKWMKVPASLGQASTKDMREMFTKEGMKWFRDVKYVGDAQVNGKDVYVYTYSGKIDGMSDYDSRIWVGKTDGMPVKITADYKTGDMKSMSIVYDYDTPVSIEPPIK